MSRPKPKPAAPKHNLNVAALPLFYFAAKELLEYNLTDRAKHKFIEAVYIAEHPGAEVRNCGRCPACERKT
jgi:hypothetical protein